VLANVGFMISSIKFRKMNHPSSTSSLKSTNPNIGGSNLTTGKMLSVLVVDDDPITRRIHKALLNKFQLEIQVAENGKEAIEFFNSGIHFDLILLDMEMPIMDGLEVSSIVSLLCYFY
jgi:PleD family two-component response regulator